MNFLEKPYTELNDRAISFYEEQEEIRRLINEEEELAVKKFRNLRDRIQKDHQDLRKIADDIKIGSYLGRYYDFIYGIHFGSQRGLNYKKIISDCNEIRYCYEAIWISKKA